MIGGHREMTKKRFQRKRKNTVEAEAEKGNTEVQESKQKCRGNEVEAEAKRNQVNIKMKVKKIK